MKILEPNIKGKILEYIPIHGVYVRVMDYGKKYFLKHIDIEPGIRSWIWVDFNPSSEIERPKAIYKFDTVINRAINDPYCTVYQFKNFDEAVENWNKIKYVQNITTRYEGTEG